MYADTTRGLEAPVQDAAPTLINEYPAALATLVRADHASHDIDQTRLSDRSLPEFRIPPDHHLVSRILNGPNHSNLHPVRRHPRYGSL